MDNIINKIYVIHYKPLIERKKYLDIFFSNNNINNYEFRDLYQRENLTNEIKKKYFKLNNLSDAQICITIEHIETYKEIVNSSNNDSYWYLIIEDDAVFCDDFIKKLNYHLKFVPKDAEYLDICDYFKIKSNNLWCPNIYTRTNCGYLIKKSTCVKLLSTIIPFEKAIDHELNKQFEIHNIKCYWSAESLIYHGSNHKYNSSYKYYK